MPGSFAPGHLYDLAFLRDFYLASLMTLQTLMKLRTVKVEDVMGPDPTGATVHD